MKLYVVGIGPGNMENMTMKAHRALESCQVIVGYPVYVDLVRDTRSARYARSVLGLLQQQKAHWCHPPA